MRSYKSQEGAAGSVLVLLLLLIVIAGFVYLFDRPDETAEARREVNEVANEVEGAVENLKEQSADALTTAKVKTAMAMSKSLRARDIDVDTEDGIVTLTGVVPSVEVKEAALAIARDTTGVVDVVDRLTVDEVALNAEPR